MEQHRRRNVRRRVVASLVRLVMIVALAALVGAVLTRIALVTEKSAGPAGFARGALQGALMPMAMPNLMIGRDVPIYAERNTGRTYKLGYTVGVNTCGAIFFGYLFWRLSRLRSLAQEARDGQPILANESRGQ